MNTQDEVQILDAIAKWLERDVRPQARELEKKDEAILLKYIAPY